MDEIGAFALTEIVMRKPSLPTVVTGAGRSMACSPSATSSAQLLCVSDVNKAQAAGVGFTMLYSPC